MAVSRQTWSRGGHWSSRNADTGLRHGFRSGLEEANAKHLASLGATVLFEHLKVPYTVPESLHHYTPDFELPNGILVETKGKFETSDRKKHELIAAQVPGLDLRFVFQRPSDPLYKGSKTTYAQWAEKRRFKWAFKLIPPAWLAEPGPERKPEDVLKEVPR